MSKRVDIHQDGRVVGSVPRPNCSPLDIIRFITDDGNRTGDPLATVRTVDFRVSWVDADEWTETAVLVADPKMGLGDLEDIRGFVPAPSIKCAHCGKPADTIACSVGGCPLGADL